MKTTLNAALKNLNAEVTRLGGSQLLLSSNVTLGAENPADCGVVAYFTLQKQQVAIPCDRWRSVAENVQAIAKTIEAMRGMQRWGASHMIRAMFQGLKALPEKASARTCWDVLGIAPTQSQSAIDSAWREKAKTCHPDLPGGSHEAMTELNTARDQASQQATLP